MTLETAGSWPIVFTEPLGKVIQCTTGDVNKHTLERLLQFYDPLLYIRWNPKKAKGWGRWEIRRKPSCHTRVFQGELSPGVNLFTSELVELDIVNHVLTLDRLSYDVLGRIKKMDTWQNKRWATDLEYDEKNHKAAIERQAREEMAYNIKQHKREWREFAALVQQGVNPAKIWKG